MGRIEKLKRQAINEANIRVLNEQKIELKDDAIIVNNNRYILYYDSKGVGDEKDFYKVPIIPLKGDREPIEVTDNSITMNLDIPLQFSDEEHVLTDPEIMSRLRNDTVAGANIIKIPIERDGELTPMVLVKQ